MWAYSQAALTTLRSIDITSLKEEEVETSVHFLKQKLQTPSIKERQT
jgi:hypothetical protein